MKSAELIEQTFDDDEVDVAKRMMVLALAKKINAGEVVPDEVESWEQFASIVNGLGRTHDDAFDIHVDRVGDSIKLIRHSIEIEMHHSAIVLLFTLLEGEINCVIRILLRIQDFSHGVISDALKGTTFNAKVDVLLPLLGTEAIPRFRQMALQCKTIRNLVVHNKATPDIHTDAGDRPSDYETTTARARQFFIEYPLETIEEDIHSFVNESVSSCQEVQLAWSLLCRNWA